MNTKYVLSIFAILRTGENEVTDVFDKQIELLMKAIYKCNILDEIIIKFLFVITNKKSIRKNL